MNKKKLQLHVVRFAGVGLRMKPFKKPITSQVPPGINFWQNFQFSSTANSLSMSFQCIRYMHSMLSSIT